MLAYRAREHDKTGQTIKIELSATNGVAFKIAVRQTMFCLFRRRSKESFRILYIGSRSTIHLSGPHNKYRTLFPCIFIPTNETWMPF